jgi:phenylacetate-coenzyme A ligase PaaK-like adenylate-forming protein
VLPDNAQDVIKQFFGVDRVNDGYGMTEQNAYLVACEHDRFHLPPWVTLYLLDPDTGRPLPREGEQVGRASFFDMTHDGGWGGIVSGDRVSASYDPCPCGRTTIHLSRKIQRFSEFTGDDDKLTCAATPAAQADALDYLNSL